MALVKLALAVLMSIVVLAAAESFDYFTVQRDVFSGFSGNVEALQRAIDTCEAALAADPKNADALVLHGVALIAQTRQHPDRAAALMMRGLAEMDRAVTMAADDLGV